VTDFICPKCGYNDIDIMYIPKGHTKFTSDPKNEINKNILKRYEVKGNYIIAKKEFLKCLCLRCRYSWTSNCLTSQD